MDRLGKYEIRTILGRGAMGTVYEGWDPAIARRVAIKTVRLPDSADSEEKELLDRFRQEAQSAGRLHHPNVVGVFDYAETDELAYIVMEFVDGRTLKHVLDETPPDVNEAVRLMEGLLAGLDYSHAHGVTHRDIKPANIIVTASGAVKIADFGIARIESSTMTQAGTIMGTPAYMSPEQFQGVKIDTRTDIYSAGVLLFQLLTGKRPFEGNMATIMQAVLNSPAPHPSDVSTSIPAALDAVVARAMARAPEDRYPTAGAFNEALQAALRAPSLPSGLGDLLGEDATIVASGTRPPSPARPPVPTATRQPPASTPAPAPKPAEKSKLPLVLAAVVVLALLGGGGAYVALGTGGKPADVVVATNTSPPVASPVPSPAAPPAPPPDPAPSIPLATPAPQAAPQAAPPAEPAPTPTAQSPATPAVPASPPRTPGRTQPEPAAPPPSPVPTTVPSPGPTTVPTAGPTPEPSSTLDRLRNAFGNQPPPQPPAPEPTPTPTPPTPQVATPTPPPTVTAFAAPSPETIRRALATAIRGAPCSAVTGDDRAGTPTLRGVIGRGSPEGALRSALQDAAPNAAIDWQVTAADGPYCTVLDVVRPYLRPFAASSRGIGVALADGRTALVTDDLVMPRVTMPDFPAHLQLDYVASDGTVLHMHEGLATSPQAALATPVYGQPKLPDFKGWGVFEPYGTDLIVGIASSVPLFRTPRPADDTLDAYLRDLRAALDQASRAGAKISATVFPIRTNPKQAATR